MGKYIMMKDIALRSWWRVPYACVSRFEKVPIPVTKDIFDILLCCDGDTEIPESPALQAALKNKLCRKVSEREHIALDPWQIHQRYHNRCMPAMNWEITLRCNYNCLHCFNASDMDVPTAEFSYAEALLLLEEAQECGIQAFTITGGEPMLHPNFMDIMKEIYRRNMHVFEINTNGYYITQKILDEMRTFGCVPTMKISFDGLGYHDWLRNCKGAEERTLQAIRLCIKNEFPVMAQVNFNKNNLESIPATLDLLDQLGVYEARIIRTSLTPRWNALGKNITFSDEELFDATLRIASEYARHDHRMALRFWHTLYMDPLRKQYLFEVFGCTPERFRVSMPICVGNRTMIAVGANGNVYPCMQMEGIFDSCGVYLGNVKTDGLKSLLQAGKYMDYICTTVKEKCEANQVCGNCPHLPYCAGGCPALGLSNGIYVEKLSADKAYYGPDTQKCYFFRHDCYQRYVKELTGRLGWKNRVPLDVYESV